MKVLVSLLFLLPICGVHAQELERRPLLGIHYELSDREPISDEPIGVEIKFILKESSAEKADLRIGDIVIEYQHNKINSMVDFKRNMRSQKTDDKVELEIIRDGKRQAKKMVLTEYPREHNDAFETIYDQVETDKGLIRTLITKPKEKKQSYPAVYVIQGIGCGSIENVFQRESSMYTLIDSLTNAGFVTMRMERSGAGDSKCTPCNEIAFNEDLANFGMGLEKLQTLPYVNKEEIYLVGLSMGGIMAPLIAEKNPVAGIVVYGTGGKDWFSYELENTLRQAFLEGVPTDEIGELMIKEQQRLFYFFTQQMSPDEIREIDVQMGDKCEDYPLHYSYFQEVSLVDPYAMWSNCKTKVLAIHGHSDFVSAGNEHALIADMVNAAHPDLAEYVEFPEADHWMRKTSDEKASFNQQSEGINLELISYISTWLQSQQ